MTEPYSIGPGPFDLRARFEATFPATIEGDLRQLVSSVPPGLAKHDVTLTYAESAKRWCPACEEPVSGLVVEAVSLMFTPSTRIAGGSERTFSFTGMNPAAYRCEPCGHRFGRDGKEIDSE